MSIETMGSLTDPSCQASGGNRSKREVEARFQNSSNRRRGAMPSAHLDRLWHKWQMARWQKTPGMMGQGISDRCAAGSAAASRTLDMDSCQTPGNTQRPASCKYLKLIPDALAISGRGLTDTEVRVAFARL